MVHSAGGPVIRHRIWRYYAGRIGECPVENLVMLAPANFGSPLVQLRVGRVTDCVTVSPEPRER